MESPSEGIHMQGMFKPFLDISSSMILSFLYSRNTTPSHSIKHYMETINPYLTIVHPELFTLRTNSNGFDSISDQDLQDPATALLVVCMHLFAHQDDSVKSMSEEGVNMPTYRAVKQILSILRTLNTPSIELIQCSLLLAFYEYSHGDLGRAYISIGDANTMALVLHVGPGKYLEAEWDAYVPYEDEECRCVYWSLFVLDCLIQTDYSLLHMPHQIPPPVVSPPMADDLLPTNHLLRYDDDQAPYYVTQRYPADTAFSVPVGIFQRNCQCAMLYTRTSFPQYHLGRSAFKLASPTASSLPFRRYDSIMKWSSSFSPLLFETNVSTWEPDGAELFSPYGDGIPTPESTSDITESLLSFQKDIDDLVLQNETEAARTAFKRTNHVV
ncbi:hypothetical protein FIE12Z_8685 [Fusarium flagelliforme]|uniref:Xylanolytic transcriptional activator regulatory domain-containing protein n=2 Tax=Fusarium flagelliforme TaxID=2675880 RepID=A0A395MGU7_9HYPO|nr:hypothetical protein FIE12Z_8685 [Fusarium flagelliforme]